MEVKDAVTATGIARKHLQSKYRYTSPRQGIREGDTWVIIFEVDVLDADKLKAVKVDALTGVATNG